MKTKIFKTAAAVVLLAATAIATSCDNDEPQKEASATSIKEASAANGYVNVIEKITDSSLFLFTYRFDERLFAHTDSVFVHYTDEMWELIERTDTLTANDVLQEDTEVRTTIGKDADHTAKKGELLWNKSVAINTFGVHQRVQIECNYKEDFSLSYLSNIHVLTFDKDDNEMDSYKSAPGINTITIVTTGKAQGRRVLAHASFYIDNKGKISIEEK